MLANATQKSLGNYGTDRHKGLNAKFDKMTRLLRLDRSEYTPTLGSKRKREGSTSKSVSSDDRLLGPINLYDPRRDGRVGKNFETLKLQDSTAWFTNAFRTTEDQFHIEGDPRGEQPQIPNWMEHIFRKLEDHHPLRKIVKTPPQQADAVTDDLPFIPNFPIEAHRSSDTLVDSQNSRPRPSKFRPNEEWASETYTTTATQSQKVDHDVGSRLFPLDDMRSELEEDSFQQSLGMNQFSEAVIQSGLPAWEQQINIVQPTPTRHPNPRVSLPGYLDEMAILSTRPSSAVTTSLDSVDILPVEARSSPTLITTDYTTLGLSTKFSKAPDEEAHLITPFSMPGPKFSPAKLRSPPPLIFSSDQQSADILTSSLNHVNGDGNLSGDFFQPYVRNGRKGIADAVASTDWDERETTTAVGHESHHRAWLKQMSPSLSANQTTRSEDRSTVAYARLRERRQPFTLEQDDVETSIAEHGNLWGSALSPKGYLNRRHLSRSVDDKNANSTETSQELDRLNDRNLEVLGQSAVVTEFHASRGHDINDVRPGYDSEWDDECELREIERRLGETREEESKQD